MKIGNLGNQRSQHINGNVSNHGNTGNVKSMVVILKKKVVANVRTYVRVHANCHYFCLILTTLEFELQISVKIPNTKFQ
jgi:hypothetical protein